MLGRRRRLDDGGTRLEDYYTDDTASLTLLNTHTKITNTDTTNEQTNKRTNELTNNEQTNKQTNEPTNDVINFGVLV